MKKTISVIIATKNRPEKIKKCLRSLLNSRLLPFEIIVVDQSTNNLTQTEVLKIKNSVNIKYFKQSKSGKSAALNLGIKKTCCEIIGFTDDDCIVDTLWTKTIIDSFQKYTNISLCFGKTLPFLPNKNIGLICPCTFVKHPDRFSITDKPQKHWEHIGFGNNMAIKKTFLNDHGLFKTWLGPGTKTKNAEDAEMIFRALVSNELIGYNPYQKIYHNKWISVTEYHKHDLLYCQGEFACYGFFALKGYSFAKSILIENYTDSIKDIFNNLLSWISGKSDHPRVIHCLQKLTAQTAGFLIAFKHRDDKISEASYHHK